MSKEHLALFADAIKSEFNLDCEWNTLSNNMQSAALATIAIFCKVNAGNLDFDESEFRRDCGV